MVAIWSPPSCTFKHLLFLFFLYYSLCTFPQGPVYKVAWSPFCPDVFLSCSSDWTIQLWRQDLQTPVLCFNSKQKAVFDIMWSPHCATVFGAVSKGKVEIWDLRVSR